MNDCEMELFEMVLIAERGMRGWGAGRGRRGGEGRGGDGMEGRGGGGMITGEKERREGAVWGT